MNREQKDSYLNGDFMQNQGQQDGLDSSQADLMKVNARFYRGTKTLKQIKEDSSTDEDKKSCSSSNSFIKTDSSMLDYDY